MPHWVKRMVNRLENTSNKKSKTDLRFRGQFLSLDMVKHAWLWDDRGFGTLRNTKLTKNHLYKNAYSCMRVHLAVQVLSYSVFNLIERYTDDIDAQNEKACDMVKIYAPLKSIIQSCDRLIDIWNINGSKKCVCINSCTYSHV